jgi:hypothetical protein
MVTDIPYHSMQVSNSMNPLHLRSMFPLVSMSPSQPRFGEGMEQRKIQV